MYSSYELWTSLCKKLVRQWNEYCCVICKQPRSFRVPNIGLSPRTSTVAVCNRRLKNEEARREQLSVLREIVAAREIAHHCRSNNNVYSQLQDLGNVGVEVDLDKLSLIQRMFLENRYIFEAIAKHIRVSDLLLEVQVCPTMDLLTTTFKTNTDLEVLKHLAEYLLSTEYYNRPRIFTDASKSSSGRCGIGVFDEETGTRIMMQLKLGTSISTAETLAIQVAMQHIDERGIDNAVLLTDSQPACLFLKKSRNSRMRNTVANDILQKAKQNRTTIQWIPAHVQVEGNEIADELAKQALSAKFVLENDIFVHDAISYFEERQASKINSWYQDYVRLKGKTLKQLVGSGSSEDPYWFTEENYTQ